MDWLNRVFSESPSLSRVNPWGLALMLIGVLIAATAGKLSEKLKKSDKNGFKLIGLLVCAGGAMLAILGK